jgi:hypothetical protein
MAQKGGIPNIARGKWWVILELEPDRGFATMSTQR